MAAQTLPDLAPRTEGGIYRLLDEVPPLHEALADDAARARHSMADLTEATRDDLASPRDPARDVLIIDFAGFVGESFEL